MTLRKLVIAVALLAAGFNLVTGVWAFFAPQSFFDAVARFEPFNEHFLHDAGAFQIALGVVLLLALTSLDALTVALAGHAVAAVLHLVSHVVDRDLGGRPTDPFALGILAALLVLALVAWTRRSYLPQRGGA